MTSALKQIEEEHKGAHTCHQYVVDKPCDTVKLARALEKTLHSLNALLTTLGASKSPWVRKVVSNSKARMDYVNAERTLEEVAGE